jgi:DNA mismatch repair protein MLH3
VLHSVKKGVLRIALVHSQVFFKVIDIERCLPVKLASWNWFVFHACLLILLFYTRSGDELLCTQPSSPLLLLKSGFGLEVSDSLHALNNSDGVLKLSGYISDPVDGFEIKVEDFC